MNKIASKEKRIIFISLEKNSECTVSPYYHCPFDSHYAQNVKKSTSSKEAK